MRYKWLVTAVVTASLYAGPASAGWNPFEAKTETKVTAGQDSPDIQEVQAEAYNGPKARVAVAQFKNKAHQRWWSPEIGDGMADMLTTALFNSGRFIVLERQTLDHVLIEQDLGASGRVRSDTAAAIGQIEGAELLITGAVTEFEGDAGGTRAIGGGIIGSVVGAVTGGVRRAHMAIDMRIIDAKTSRILAATSVEGSSTDVDVGGAIGGAFGGGALGGALSSWENTPKEKALRECINKAVEFIVGKTPTAYYRHGQGSTYNAAYSRPSSSARAAPQSPRYSIGSYARVNSSKLNVRAGPGTGNPVVVSLSAGQPLQVQAQQGNWVQVKMPDARSGWVAGWLIRADATVTEEAFLAHGKDQPAAAAVTEPEVSAGSEAAPVSTSADEESAMERLSRLRKLRDAGLIDADDYEAKKQEILKTL